MDSRLKQPSDASQDVVSCRSIGRQLDASRVSRVNLQVFVRPEMSTLQTGIEYWMFPVLSRRVEEEAATRRVPED